MTENFGLEGQPRLIFDFTVYKQYAFGGSYILNISEFWFPYLIAPAVCMCVCVFVY
jgi:hypothetical protein